MMRPIFCLRAGLALLWLSSAVAFAQQTKPAPTADKPPAAEKPLATVNGVPIKQSVFDQAIKQAIAQGNPDTPQLREALKNQLIARELFLQEASKQGLDKDPEVLAAVEEAKRNAMVQRYLRGQIQLKAATEEEARAYYERVRAGLGPKEYKLRVLMVPNEQRAKEIRDQLAKGKDFAELARQWSDAPSAPRGGDVDWVSFKSPAKEGETQGLPLPLAQAIEKLQKGKASDPIEFQGRWWMVKVEDARATKVPTFEEAKANIYRLLNTREAERATGELVAKLSKAATIAK